MEKAFVKYDIAGNLVSGVLRTGDQPPSGKGWVEVPSSLCCSTVVIQPVVPGAGQLKGFIKFGKDGRVVKGSTVTRKKTPTDGKWLQIPYNRCC